MIKLLDESTIAFSAHGDSTTYGIADTLEKLERGDAFAGLELLLWGVIAAQREQTNLIVQSTERAKSVTPDIESIIAGVSKSLPGVLASLGVETSAGTSTTQVFPKNGGDAAEASG
jgi:hypothetical protein